MSTSEPVSADMEEPIMPKPERSYLAEGGIVHILNIGFTPEKAEAVWEWIKDAIEVLFTGITFAILSYFFFGGAYLQMFGLYIFCHIEVLNCVLYELIFLAPADVPILELILNMEVCRSYLTMGLCYFLMAVILELSSFLIWQLIRVSWNIFKSWSIIMWHLHFGIWDLIPDSLWARVILFGCGFFFGHPLDIFKRLWFPATWILRTLLPLVVFLVSATPSFSYAAWRNISCWILQPPSKLVKRMALLCFQRHTNQPYTYKPLQAGCEIRLLRLNGKISGPMIQGNLIHTSIEKLPDYECISYVWGDATGKETIVLDDRIFEVSANVFDILSQRKAIFSRRLLWIDSVCINQKDIKERTHQVKLMQKIYGKASRATIWLGNPPDAGLAWMLLHKLVFHVSWRTAKARNENIMASYLRASKRNGGATPPEWLALRKLFRNPWFERCWVVQELTLASDVFMIYGGYYIHWKMFMSIIPVFIQESSAITLFMLAKDGEHTSPVPVGLLNGPIMSSFQRMYRKKETIQLHEVLRICLTFRATDPRDKIFALQGITEAANDIPIDYELEIEEVLMNTARYFLRRPEALEVLQFAGVGWIEDEKRPKIPSWFVDWTRTRGFEAMVLSSLNTEQHAVYLAGVQENPQIREVDAQTIEIGGLHIDTIKARGKTMRNPGPDDRITFRENDNEWFWWIREAESIIRHLPVQYHTGQPRPEAFWRTCICDQSGAGNRPAVSDYGERFLDAKENNIKEYLRINSLNRLFLSQDEQEFLQEREKNSSPFMETLNGNVAFTNALGTSCNGRCFAVTENGYMAITPPGTKEGDMVCLFMGARVPFIMRPLPTSDSEGSNENQSYALVGECYVHGMMDGEGLRLGLDVQKFVVR